jgi:hypothetical protein
MTSANAMPESGAGSMEWLGVRVPLWAMAIAIFGTGIISVQGGGALLFQNNQPQFEALQAQITEQQADHKKIFDELGKKVDNSTRLEMLQTIYDRITTNARLIEEARQERLRQFESLERRITDLTSAQEKRLEQLERHLENTDARINALRDFNAPPSRYRSPGAQ